MFLNRKITRLLSKEHHVDYVGFADLLPYQEELAGAGGPAVAGYPVGISVGISLPDSIVDLLPERQDLNVSCLYRRHAYEIINDRLNAAASSLSSVLNSEGYRTLPIPAADHTEAGKATVSHKMIAHIAGLGWIGKSCLLVTPQHGPRVRFVSLLTEAPIKAVNEPMEQRCGGCARCAQICPTGAIKGKSYVQGDPRDARLDFGKCNGYFEELKKDRPYPVCGMCLFACPYGKQPLDGQANRG
jgi:epoxyqueuosine reductase